MKLLRCLAVMCFLLRTCHAQLPEYYQTINRVTWLSQNIDAILPTWIALGITLVQIRISICERKKAEHLLA